MDKRKTIYNWKWWLVLPFVLPLVAILLIPRVIICTLEMVISAVELVNIGERNCGLSKRLVDWVHKNT